MLAIRRSTILNLIGWLIIRKENEWALDLESVSAVSGFVQDNACLIGHLTLKADDHTVEINQTEVVPGAISVKIILDGKKIHEEVLSNPIELLSRIHLLIKRHPDCKGLVDKLMVPPAPDPAIIAKMTAAIKTLNELAGKPPIK